MASFSAEPTKSAEKNKDGRAHVHDLKLMEGEKPENFKGRKVSLRQYCTSMRLIFGSNHVAVLMYLMYLS